MSWITALIFGGIAGWLAERFMKSNMELIMNIVLGIVGAASHFECLRHQLGRMGRLPDFRLHRRSLADLDRPRRTIGLRTSEARSTGGIPTVGKRDKWPSHPLQ